MPRIASLSFLLSFWLSGQFVYGIQESIPRCRCLYGDPCWPSEDEFAQLSTEISHPLVKPTPFAQPCYLPGASYAPSNSSTCTIIAENWDNGTFRSGHPGTMEAPNFETFVSSAGQLHACFLNTTLGAQRCEQGSVPVVGVEAHTANDIQVAVKFAAKHNLRLVIKNTGYAFSFSGSHSLPRTRAQNNHILFRHDYLGRSSGRGSFMIWTHHMKNITVHDAFRPSGSLSSEIFEHGQCLQTYWHIMDATAVPG